MVASLV